MTCSRKRPEPSNRCPRSSRALLVALLLAGCGEPAPEPAAQSPLAPRARAALAKTSGEIRLAGLKGPVEVLRDRWGVPHLYAQNPDDLFFAQGFVQAQDRLWQMEIWRRSTEGRLAEIAGPAAVERDRIARLIRYRGEMAAEWTSYSPDARAIIEAFVRGVNAFIESGRENPPIEFQLTGLRPEAWTPEVCLGRLAGFTMCRNLSAEVSRAQLVRDLGPERAAALLPTDPPVKIEVPEGFDPEALDPGLAAALGSVSAPLRVPLLDDKDSGHGKAALEVDLPTEAGSNNWTLAGRLTRTGKPILANDPHRAILLPSLRYVVHLHCPPRGGDRGWNVIGGTEPALPGVSIGHNERVGWGLTIVGTDQQDLYVEQIHPEDPNLYKIGDEWRPLRVEREEIRVRGEREPRAVELKFTRHGPVLFEDRKRRLAWALRWAGSEPGTAGYLAALALDRARDGREFLEAAARWKVPSENLVYADVDGHIGWIAAALTPVRRGWTGLLPVPGASGKYEWDGWLPTSELPQRFDPPEGYVATANHNILPTGYRHAIAYEWAAPFRFGRIDEVLKAGKPGGLTLEDSERLQHDAISIPARRLLALFREVALDPTLQPSADLLRRWDGVLSRESAAAALYAVWQSRLAERVLKSRLPEKHRAAYANRLPLAAAIHLLEEMERAERDAALTEALRDAVADLSGRLGTDQRQWSWGQLHQARLRHMLSRTLETESLFDLPPVPRDGDSNTPLAAGGPNFEQTSGASYRHVLDLGDWDRSVATGVPGQSGQPGSPHYADLLPLWAEGRYHPLPFTRPAVEAATTQRLVLRPK